MRIHPRYRLAGALGAALLIACLTLAARPPRTRAPIAIPDIPGFVTLKCDFHIHTVFSDGKVWPDIRAEEAWREGLDAIAITDHIEAQPHRRDLPTNHNRSHEIAAAYGDTLDLIVIRGGEITRQMPPGHLNAIFLHDVEPLDTSPHIPRSERHDWFAAIAAAHAQQAFIFWNHPGWIRQAPDGIAKWYPEHTRILEAGMLHGIEVVNDHNYYPEAHQWCIDHNLTLLSNSDVHPPITMQYDLPAGERRPLTLVFAREATAEAIREALFDRRTAVYSADRLIGDERFLRPIFEQSAQIPQRPLRLHGRSPAHLQIHNASSVPYQLELIESDPACEVPAKIVLHPGRTVLFSVRALDGMEPGTHTLRPRYRVTNLLVRPNEAMAAELPFTVELLAD
jgi:hypothetical protein